VQLISRRDAIYALIRELDADHQTGKINDEDYQALRQRYVTEGVAVLKQLDAMPRRDGRAALEAEVEAQVLALRRSGAAPAAAGPRSSAQFCTQCGHPVEPADRFCARCGAALKETASQ
jgi:NADH pyrophosphatase NudC (nudix superfamily)